MCSHSRALIPLVFVAQIHHIFTGSDLFLVIYEFDDIFDKKFSDFKGYSLE